MDNETFETLAEVLAFECKDDQAKYDRFCKIFYGDYPNKPPSFIDLGSMSHSQKGIVVYMNGAKRAAYIDSYTVDHESPRGGFRGGYMGYEPEPDTRVRLELRVRF